jgi:endonuclease G
MSKTARILIGLYTVLAMPGCSHDSFLCGFSHIEETVEPTPATFVATITPQTVTRAVDTSWDANDQIGITASSGDISYSNVALATLDADGRFEVVDAANPIQFMSNKEVTFAAYYPWTEGVISTLRFSASNQAEQKSFDFLYGIGRGSAIRPDVTLTFQHVMSKAVITLKAGDDITAEQLQAAQLQLQGLMMSGTFNVLTGEITIGDDGAATVDNTVDADTNIYSKVSDDGTAVEYTLILPPQQLDEPLTMVFNIDGVLYTATLILPNENSLQGSTRYEVDVTIRKGTAIVDACTITAWDQSPLDDVTAKPTSK